MALAFAFALSSTSVFADTTRHKSGVKIHRGTQPVSSFRTPKLLPNYGNPNGDPDGPTTLSGTGSSQYGGSSAGTSGRN
jgi:hypothetical protein